MSWGESLVSCVESESPVSPDSPATFLTPLLLEGPYASLSWILQFLHVFELLKLRRVCRFFQDVVRVSFTLRPLHAEELFTIMLFWNGQRLKTHSNFPRFFVRVCSDQYCSHLSTPPLGDALRFVARVSKSSLNFLLSCVAGQYRIAELTFQLSTVNENYAYKMTHIRPIVFQLVVPTQFQTDAARVDFLGSLGWIYEALFVEHQTDRNRPEKSSSFFQAVLVSASEVRFVGVETPSGVPMPPVSVEHVDAIFRSFSRPLLAREFMRPFLLKGEFQAIANFFRRAPEWCVHFRWTVEEYGESLRRGRGMWELFLSCGVSMEQIIWLTRPQWFARSLSDLKEFFDFVVEKAGSEVLLCRNPFSSKTKDSLLHYCWTTAAARCLLEACPQLLHSVNAKGETPAVALMRGKSAVDRTLFYPLVLDIMVKIAGLNVNEPVVLPSSGRRSLMSIAIEHSNVKCLDWLRVHKARLIPEDTDLKIPDHLIMAVYQKSHDFERLLTYLTHAGVLFGNRFDSSAFDVFCRDDSLEGVKLLSSLGIWSFDEFIESTPLLLTACRHGAIRIVRHLLVSLSEPNVELSFKSLQEGLVETVGTEPASLRTIEICQILLNFFPAFADQENLSPNRTNLFARAFFGTQAKKYYWWRRFRVDHLRLCQLLLRHRPQLLDWWAGDPDINRMTRPTFGRYERTNFVIHYPHEAAFFLLCLWDVLDTESWSDRVSTYLQKWKWKEQLLSCFCCKGRLGTYSPLTSFGIFHFACWKGDQDRVSFLLDSGVDVNWKTTHPGVTGVRFAALGGHWALVRFLLSKGATVVPRFLRRNRIEPGVVGTGQEEEEGEES